MVQTVRHVQQRHLRSEVHHANVHAARLPGRDLSCNLRVDRRVAVAGSRHDVTDNRFAKGASDAARSTSAPMLLSHVPVAHLQIAPPPRPAMRPATHAWPPECPISSAAPTREKLPTLCIALEGPATEGRARPHPSSVKDAGRGDARREASATPPLVSARPVSSPTRSRRSTGSEARRKAKACSLLRFRLLAQGFAARNATSVPSMRGFHLGAQLPGERGAGVGTVWS